MYGRNYLREGRNDMKDLMNFTCCFKKCAAAFLGAALMLSAAAAPVGAAEPDRIDEILDSMTLQEKAAQMIIADFRTWNEDPQNEESEAVPVTVLPEEVEEAIRRDHFGGIILFAENCSENEPLVRLVSQMQIANLEGECANPVPLLIAIDQEGGAVARLGQGCIWPGNMALTATGDPENAKLAARTLGGEIAALGINTDFAPVMDVNSNPRNPIIGTRSFSDDPQTVSTYGVSFVEGLKETGTITALKHFPGHGDVATDSHTGFPVQEKTYDELKECELVPFQAAIDAGADMVMTAHIQYPSVDSRTYTSTSTGEEVYYPATLSDRVLKDILREDMGFEGVIVSDALNMAAIADNFKPEDVTRMALEAGIDMFLMPVPVTDSETLKALDQFIADICALVEDGSIPESRLDESVRRILKMKEDHGILDLETKNFEQTDEEVQEAAEAVGSPENHEVEWQLTQRAVTLVKNDNDVLPIKAEPGEHILVLYTAGSRIAAAEYARLRLVEEGLIPEDVAFDALVCSAETAEDCVKAVDEADAVIIVSSMFGQADLDPATEDGAASAVLDDVIGTSHEQQKPAVVISSYLPYDAARYTDADAILIAYGSRPMRELPGEKVSVSPNIPCAVCGIFGEYEFSGKLPVDIPEMDEAYQFTDKILYTKAID